MSDGIDEVAMLEAALEQGLQLRRAGAGEAALEVLDLIIGHFREARHPAAEQAISRAMLGRALALLDVGREAEALDALDELLERLRGRDESVHRHLRILAAYEAATILGGQGDHGEAAQGFAFAIAQARGDEPPAVTHVLAACHLKLATACLHQDDPAGAAASLDALFERWGGAEDAALRHWVEEGCRMRAALTAST